MTSEATLETTAQQLLDEGVVGVTIAWADNNGITRSRTVPVQRLPDVARTGVGITTLFAVFDSHDAITFAHKGLANASGDVRLIPDAHRLTRLAGQPRFAWAPGRQRAADGSSWPYDQLAVLERQVARAAAAGLELRAGFELEFFVSRGDGDEPVAAHHGPAYSAPALLDVDEFAASALADLAANGIAVGQLHAEYGPAQLEVSLGAADPVTAADQQLLARQTLRAAARRHGLRVSFAPLITPDGVGNGVHIHTSIWRGEVNLLGTDSGQPERRPSGEGASYIAGLLRDLPAVVALTAPSVPSQMRLRPGHFSSAFTFWGVENREAALRYVPGTQLLGAGNANLELKPSDASGNPYLALAAIIASGLAGIEDRLTLPDPISEDPGDWSDQRRRDAAVARLPTTPQEQEHALTGNARLGDALGEPLLGAFIAVRRSDAAWAEERSAEDVVAAHRWLY
jgi:glutamine synthetase